MRAHKLTSRGRPGAWRVSVVFVCALVYLAGGIRVGPGGDRPPFASDEAHKLSESYYYHLFFEEGAWRHPDWQADFYARTNPPVAKYVFGAALAAAGWHVRDQRLQEDFGSLWRTRDVLRRKVPDPMLRVARGVSAAYGALVCALLFWIGQRAGGPIAGLLAALLLLTNPNFLAAARRGLTDTIVLFHLTLIVPASLWSVRTLRERSGWGRLLAMTALVPGVVVALATGSKMNGALSGPVYAVSLVLAALVEPGAWRRGRLVARSVLAAGLTAVVAVAVLVALDPTLYDRPLARLLESFVVWGDWMVKQQIDPGFALFDVRERAAFASVLALRTPGVVRPRLVGVLESNLLIVGFCLGLASLAAASLRQTRTAATAPAAGDAIVVLCWIVGVVAGVTLWMPVARYRYALPPIVAISLTAAIGLAVLPRAGRLIVAAARRSPLAPGPVTVLAGVLGVTALAFGVARIADPVQVDPGVNSGFTAGAAPRSYLEAARRHPGSLASQQRAGALCLMAGRRQEAAGRFAAALALIPHDPPPAGSWAVRRSVLLFKLARARAGAGDLAGALDALLEHVAAVRQVRAGLYSGDPMVRGAFDQLIAEREAMTKELSARIEASGEHGGD